MGCSIVETFSKSAKPRELEEVLRLEYRSKLLNPKWAQAMAGEVADRAPAKWHLEYIQLKQRTTRCFFKRSCAVSSAAPHCSLGCSLLYCTSVMAGNRTARSSADQGSGGAFEISQRMTAMIGWGATTDFKDKWVYDQAADQYVMDQEMADKLRK